MSTCTCGHGLHEHAGTLETPKICTVLACACKRYAAAPERKAYAPPAVADTSSCPPANDRERVALAEFVRKCLRDSPFVLAYLDVQPDGMARIATLSNATEPQRIMRAALEELERQALAQRPRSGFEPMQ